MKKIVFGSIVLLAAVALVWAGVAGAVACTAGARTGRLDALARDRAEPTPLRQRRRQRERGFTPPLCPLLPVAAH